MRGLILAFVALILAGCPTGPQPLLDALTPPSITADPIPPFTSGGGAPTLTATITAPGGALEIVGVTLLVNRDRDVARFNPAGLPGFAVTPPPQSGTGSEPPSQQPQPQQQQKINPADLLKQLFK